MDRSEVYPDVLGDALSVSSQRVAQLGSLDDSAEHVAQAMWAPARQVIEPV